MRPLRAWSRRVLGMFRTTRHERELAAEVESHLQLHLGMSLLLAMVAACGAGPRPPRDRGRSDDCATVRMKLAVRPRRSRGPH
jgi:hypothetical protein